MKIRNYVRSRRLFWLFFVLLSVWNVSMPVCEG